MTERAASTWWAARLDEFRGGRPPGDTGEQRERDRGWRHGLGHLDGETFLARGPVSVMNGRKGKGKWTVKSLLEPPPTCNHSGAVFTPLSMQAPAPPCSTRWAWRPHLSLPTCAVQYGHRWPHVSSEPLKCGWSKLRCAVNIKHKPISKT